VGKGMLPAQVLILRAKRLIDFFMRPKQSERLEEVQKLFPDLDKTDENENEDENEDEEENHEEKDDEICDLLKNNSKLVSLNI